MRFLSILVDFLVQKIKSGMAAKMPVVMKSCIFGVMILVSGF